MKKIFIYYSESGNGDIVANYLKEKGYDIEKIVAKPLPKAFFLKMMVGGFKASIGYKDKINELEHDLNNYDEIIIGSPIWNGRLSSPIRGLLNKYDFNKKLDFILYSGSGEGKVAYNFIKKNYKNSNITFLKQPKNNNDELNKISFKGE